MRTILFLLIGLGYVYPAASQHLSHCDWKLILTESTNLVEQLEQNILSIGDSTIAFEDKDQFVNDSGRLFNKDAKVISDLEPNASTKKTIVGTRSNSPKAYLNDIPLYYKNLEVKYEDLKVSYMDIGDRFKRPQVTYEFKRVLNAVDDKGIEYQDEVDRQVSFYIKKDGGEWLPFISSMDYDKSRTAISSVQGRVSEVDNGCRSELSERLAREQKEAEEALEREREAAEAELDRLREAEEERARQEREAIAKLEEEKQQAAEEELRREQAARQEELKRLEEDRKRALAEEEKRIKEIERRQALEQKRLRIKARRKRLFAPTAYLGVFALNQTAVQKLDDDGGVGSSMFTTLGGGVDLAYLKGEFSLTLDDEPLANRSLVENGFPAGQNERADSVGIITGSVVAGLPLMLGKNFVLFAGGGGMYTGYFFKDSNDEDAGSFSQVSPIVQASLTWISPERGGGVTLSYRKSFNGKFSDVNGIGVVFNYYPTKKR